MADRPTPLVDLTTITDAPLREAVRSATVGVAIIRCSTCGAVAAEVFDNKTTGGRLVIAYNRDLGPIERLAVTLRDAGAEPRHPDGDAIGHVSSDLVGDPALVTTPEDELPLIECHTRGCADRGPLALTAAEVLAAQPRAGGEPRTIRARALRQS